MTAPRPRPTLCEDCEEAPARRVLEDRWVCENCLRVASMPAQPAAMPAAEAPAPEALTWRVFERGAGIYRKAKWMCCRATADGEVKQWCGVRHKTETAAQRHLEELNG